MPLFQGDFTPLAHQGAQHLLLVAELIGYRARAIGNDGEQVFNGAGMPPGENPVDALHLRVEPVVGGGTDPDHAITPPQQCAQVAGDFQEALIAGNALAVAHPHSLHPFSQAAVSISGGNRQRAEKVALAAFIHAHVRLIMRGIHHLLVSEADGAQHLRFQHKLDEIGGLFTLHQAFPAVVKRNAAAIGIGRRLGVFHAHRAVIAAAQEFRQQDLLGVIQREGEGCRGLIGCHCLSIPQKFVGI